MEWRMANVSPDETVSRPNDPYQLDRRLTILETRFDTILPTLATKADLGEVKSQLKTLFITMLLGFATLVIAMVGMMFNLVNLLRP
jgi:hypothetical protein